MKKIAILLAGLFLTILTLEAQTIIDDSTEVSGTWT